ncbi:MAG: hypothetical protein HC881_22305 [Leptolyngbyaceae cyanobacterium SL_7_1]|nr:hypothetical protein [Leptolyngbyaceae cyanobacterium SL_7_1]
MNDQRRRNARKKGEGSGSKENLLGPTAGEGEIGSHIEGNQQSHAGNSRGNSPGIQTVTIPMNLFEQILNCLPQQDRERFERDLLDYSATLMGLPKLPDWLDDFSPIARGEASQ